MNRRALLRALGVVLVPRIDLARAVSVSTLIGTGSPGYSDSQVANPYGLALGPDGALYFCDLGQPADSTPRSEDSPYDHGRRQRPARLRGQRQRGGRRVAQHAARNPVRLRGNLYIAERDNHVVRVVEAGSGRISTFAGTGTAGFSGDGGPASARNSASRTASPSSLAGGLLICDVGNHRIRRVEFATGVSRPGVAPESRRPTPDGAPLAGTPLNGPRTLVFDVPAIFLALREGNAIFGIDAGRRRSIMSLARANRAIRRRRSRPAGAIGRTKGIGLVARRAVCRRHRESRHSPDRPESRRHHTVLGTGQRGDGPEPDPLRCALNRPHGVLVDARGVLYVGDSEAHRIRVMPSTGGVLE